MSKKNPPQIKDEHKDGEPSMIENVDGFLIAGLGASAGGVQALKEFFSNVPAESGIAYVVILHLSPEYDSQLAEVLSWRIFQ